MKKKHWFYYLLLFILVLPVVASFFRPGFFPSHDGEWMVIRLSDFHRSFVSGQLPVRWAARLNHGYGYPVFNFLYPLSLYLGEFFHLIGFDFVSAIKLVFVVSFFFSGWLMYFWIKQKWGRLAALMAALVYVYTPYRLLDVYVRGSLGEALAFVFPPLLFWALERLQQKFNKQVLVIGALALAGLVMAHNTLALLFLILLGFYWLYLRRPKSFVSMILLGLGLSAFFWLPALWDKQFVIFEKAPVSNFFAHFPTLRQLIMPSWGYGPSLPLSDQDQMSFQVGVLSLIIGLISLIWWRKNFFTISFWLVFLMMLSLSSWVWRVLLIYNLIQFPWRLLALTTFLASILAGLLVSRVPRQWQIALLLLSAGFFFWQARIYARPEYFVERPLEFYTTNEATTTVSAEYTPIWVKELPTSRAKEKVEIVSGRGEVRDLFLNSKKISFDINLTESGRIRVNSHYFPGWTVFANSQRQTVDYQTSGLIEFNLPAGQSSVQVVFRETRLRQTADVLSLLSLLITAILFFKK